MIDNFFKTIALCVGVSIAATHVAVLETISEKDLLSRSEKIFLTDKLRERAQVVLPDNMGFVIMTRENINAVFPSGESLENCEGSCLAETGKKILADYVMQARVGKFGSQLTFTAELYETTGNNLIGTITAHKSNIEGLLDEIESRVDSLFAKIKVRKVPSNMANKGDLVNNGKILIDSRDGKRYKITKIGKQIWMTENLNYIPKDGLLKKNSRCYLDQLDKCDRYGRLYGWKISKDICPSGWHTPSTAEFEELIYTAGGKNIAGNALKAKGGWKKDFFKNANGSDIFGFSALPGGYINADGFSWDAGKCAYFWSSTEQSLSNAFGMVLCEDGLISTGLLHKKNAFSIRCVKDSEE